jgi:hypothetical protein
MPSAVDLLRRTPVRQPLWGSDDAVRVVVVDVLAAIVLGIAFVMCDRQDAVADQIVWINLGAAGLVASGVAHGRWLLAARNAVGRRRVRLLVEDEPVADGAGSDGAGSDGSVVADPEVPAGAVFVATATGTVFHRPGCSMVDGRTTKAGSSAVHLRAGRRPCPICEP